MEPVYLPIVEAMVKRYRCPYCNRSASKKSIIREHLKRCWRAAENKTCMTCRFEVPRQCDSWADADFGGGCSCRYQGRECKTTCHANIDVTEIQINCPKWAPDLLQTGQF